MATTKAQTTTYIDLDLDFTRNPATNDVSFKKDEEAIKRSVRNLVLTNFGERKFHPEIGSDAYGFLFENMSPLTAHNWRLRSSDWMPASIGCGALPVSLPIRSLAT